MRVQVRTPLRNVLAVIGRVVSNVIIFLYFFLDGQKIAKKLSTQIAKESQKLKSLLPEYNVCRSVNGESTMSLAEAFDTEKLLMVLPGRHRMSSSESRRQTIDAYIMLSRTNEEVTLLQSEIENFSLYYTAIRSVVTRLVADYSKDQTDFSRGAVSLLHNMLFKVENTLKNCCSPLDTDFDSDSDSDLEE